MPPLDQWGVDQSALQFQAPATPPTPTQAEPAQQQSGLSFGDVRRKYPQYDDLSDEQLATGLHKKFYSDMPFDQFSAKIGLPPPESTPRRLPLAQRDEGPPVSQSSLIPTGEIPQSDADIPDGPLKRIGQSAIEGARQGWGNEPLGMTAQEEEGMRQMGVFQSPGRGGPLRAANEALVKPLWTAGQGIARLGGAGLGAVQGAVAQTGEEVGAPQLGREIAALPEAFPQESMGMRGVLDRTQRHAPTRTAAQAEEATKAQPSPSQVTEGVPESAPPPTGAVAQPQPAMPMLERMAAEARKEPPPTMDNAALPAPPKVNPDLKPLDKLSQYPGGTANVWRDGDTIIRSLRNDYHPASPEDRPASDRILQPIEVNPAARTERLPFVEGIKSLDKFSEADVADLKAGLAKDGLEISDPRGDNFAVHDGRLIVIDAGAVRQIEPSTPPPPPPRIRTIQQIQDQDEVGAKKAAAIQASEIEAIGRPITDEERTARAAGVQNTAPARPSPPQPRTIEPTERLPPEPQRLVNFLRAKWTDENGNERPGGIRDDGGDVRSIIGGNKGRPGLINSRGDNLDNATMRAWQAGYLPEFSDRPQINDLLEKIDHDHNLQPVYSMHDAEGAAAYMGAIQRNAEIDRLASDHGIDTSGKTREQFFDALAEKLSSDEAAHEMQSHADALDHAYRTAEAEAKRWAAQQAGEPVNLKEIYGQSQARTLRELEDEHQQIETATASEQRAPGYEQPGPATANQGPLPESAQPRGGGAGLTGSDETQDHPAWRAEPAADIKPVETKRAAELPPSDQSVVADKATNPGPGIPPLELQGEKPPVKRAPEPPIRTDPNQAAMPGMGASAKQAQAARDAQGRGALQSDVAQKPANEGLFAPDTSGQGKLYAGPTAIFDPDAWKWVTGPLGVHTKVAVAALGDLGDSISRGLVPMRTGSMRAQAFAGRFANSLRQVMFRYGQIDKEIERNFKPADREIMGRALDAQSVFEQQARDLPQDQQAAARAAFDGGKTGVAGLTPQQRNVVEMLDSLSQATWRRMQERGLVAPEARGLPYYFPRQILNWSEEAGFSRPTGGGGGANAGLEGRGKNLTTAGPMSREHLTPEETEAAAKAKLGQQAMLLRDIRSLPARLAYSERSIAGVDLMNQIKKVGDDTGSNLVLHGDIPGAEHPADFFTIADHPSFRKWTGTGWQAIHVSREFEGPLRAVLTQSSPGWYQAAMKLKGGVMSAIMYSPFIHLAVELGRALPIMLAHPVGTLTMKVLRDGSTMRRDLDFMDQATKDGLAPLGSRWAADPVSIADQANVEGRKGFLGALANARDAAANGVGKVFGQTAHDIIQHPHQTLLWDQVFNLQVGLYNQLRNDWTKKGFDPQVAGTMAAHIANRYAGALPAEHLSKAANMAANLTLFSRSFTLGNLGVMKDMFNGAPSHVRAQIEQMAGSDVAKSAQSALRRKAISAVTMDIGLFYMGNALLQAGLQAMRQGSDETENDWMNKAGVALDGLAHGNVLSAFGVLPQHWNEPGKQDRVFAGTDSTGRGVYLRLPPGMVGVEFLNWAAKPGTMLEAKLSPLVRPIIEDILGEDTLGRKLYPPNPQTLGDGARIAGLAIRHFVEGLGPTSTIQGAHELWQQHIEGKKTQADPGISLLKILGPMTGLAQVSSGYPGGPAAGEIHAETEREKFNQQKAMPDIRQKILNGDIEGARQDMTALGMAPGLQSYYLRQTVRPGPSKSQERQFQRAATPEARQRLEMLRGATQ